MKNLLGAFFIMLSGMALKAQDTALVQPPILPPYDTQEISREKIQIRDLPEAVREALEMPDYAGWSVNAAYKVVMIDPETPKGEGRIAYVIDLTRRHEKTSITFDKDGKRLDDDDD